MGERIDSVNRKGVGEGRYCKRQLYYDLLHIRPAFRALQHHPPGRLQGQVCIASRGEVKKLCIEVNAVAARM